MDASIVIGGIVIAEECKGCCRSCRGTTKVPSKQFDHRDRKKRDIPCESCGGSGHKPECSL